MEEFKVKEDCFGYNSKTKKCTALISTYCKKTNCNFYKTKEENARQKAEAESRAENKEYFLKQK